MTQQIDAELRDILACPACKSADLAEVDGGILCGQCHRVYRVHDGIPDLVEGSKTSPAATSG